jgi:hypothetical protein
MPRKHVVFALLLAASACPAQKPPTAPVEPPLVAYNNQQNLQLTPVPDSATDVMFAAVSLGLRVCKDNPQAATWLWLPDTNKWQPVDCATLRVLTNGHVADFFDLKAAQMAAIDAKIDAILAGLEGRR